MVNSPSDFAATSSASFSTCSVKARRYPQTDTFHSVARASPAKAMVMAAAAAEPRYLDLLNFDTWSSPDVSIDMRHCVPEKLTIATGNASRGPGHSQRALLRALPFTFFVHVLPD